MGSLVVVELLKKTKELVQARSFVKWRSGTKSVMLDVFMRRERHLFFGENSESLKSRPSVREFGPQNEEDMIDQRGLEILEKLLPVINGLIYQNKGKYISKMILLLEIRDSILGNIEHLMTLFDVFKCQLPIELHENALYAILNLLQSASKQVKEFLIV
jgi:hypothetical protein